MTAPGSLIAFRALVDGRAYHDTRSGTYAIPVEAFDALVDAVEALRRGVTFRNGAALKRADEVLSRFDFGSETRWR